MVLSHVHRDGPAERSHLTPPTLFQEAAELQLAVPLAKLARQVLVIPLQDVAFVAEILDDGAVRESSTRRRVADVASVLRLVRRLAHWRREGKKKGAGFNFYPKH